MGGDGTGYYNGAKITGIGNAVSAALSIIVYLVWEMEPSPMDFFAIVTGIIGFVAGNGQNKGMLTCYMISAIVVIVYFVFAFMGYSIIAAGCGAASEGLEAMCQNPAGVEGYCCWACPSTSCESIEGGDGGLNCEVQPAYTVSYCANYGEGMRNADGWLTNAPVDRAACENAANDYPLLNPPISWVTDEYAASCQENHGLNKAVGSGSTAACVTDAQRNDWGSGCGPTATGIDDFSTQKWEACAGNCNYSNKGCSYDENGLMCAHINGVYFLTFLTLCAAIAGSVMGCCVVCCGNDEVGGKDDSG